MVSPRGLGGTRAVAFIHTDGLRPIAAEEMPKFPSFTSFCRSVFFLVTMVPLMRGLPFRNQQVGRLGPSVLLGPKHLGVSVDNGRLADLGHVFHVLETPWELRMRIF